MGRAKRRFVSLRLSKTTGEIPSLLLRNPKWLLKTMGRAKRTFVSLCLSKTTGEIPSLLIRNPKWSMRSLKTMGRAKRRFVESGSPGTAVEEMNARVSFPPVGGVDKLFSGGSDGLVQAWHCISGHAGTLNVGGEIGCLVIEGDWLYLGLPSMVKARSLGSGADYNLSGPSGQVYALDVEIDR
ncbi:hypothetical protein LINGRAHAP2_LOCUS15861 [Linum grandiflorum]